LDNTSILAIITENIRAVVPDLSETPITASDTMSQLGLDSVERQEVVMLTLEAIGLEIPLVQLRGPRTIGDLAELLHAKREG
jgi:polyketide biosynthesis acyl carrier protein